MTRKIILIIISLLSLGVILFFLYQKDFRTTATHPLSAIPENAAIVFKSRDFNTLWKQLSHTNLMWQEITQTPYFRQLDENGQLLDSLIYENKELQEVFDELPLWASLHMTGGSGFEFLYVFSMPVEEERFSEILKKLNVTPASERTFQNAIIVSLKLENYPRPVIFCSVYKGIVMCSFSQVLLEDAIAELDREGSGLLENASFQKALSTSGEYVDANVFLQYEQLNKLFAATLNPDEKEQFSALSHYADWASLDLTLKPNSMMFNGFTTFSDSSTGFLSCFEGQKPQDMDLLSVIPAKSSNILCFGLSNFELFFGKFKTYLNKYGQGAANAEWIDAVNREHGIDAEEELKAFMGNEMGTFYFHEDEGTEQIDRKFFVLRTSNFNQARNFFGLFNGGGAEEEREGVAIHHISSADVTGNFFGSTFGGFEETYYVALDPYIVFSNSLASMRGYVDNYLHGTAMNRDENFIHFSENLSSQSSILMYSNFSRSREFYTNYAGDKLKEIIEMYQEMLGKFEAVAVQLTADKPGMFYQNIYCNYNPVVKKETRSLWETVLDTLLTSRPYTVLNHYTKAKEIFVQDVANRIYLIDNKGNVLWKKQLEEPIVSEVWQIDVYKNNKLQLLFNTASELHLIDRNGHYVENYPVKIKSGASAGLTLLDYDNDKNYRILIPANNRKLLNFNAMGREVDGWEFKKARETIRKQVQYFVLNGKDYLVTIDEEGGLYVLNRRGETRLQLNEKLPVSDHGLFLELHSDIMNCKLVTADSIGNVVKIRFDDHKEHVNIASFSGNCQFGYHDLNNDRSYEYIYLDEDKLQVFGQQKEKIFDADFNGKTGTLFQYFSHLGKYGRIAVLDREEKKIYLYLDAGGLATDFPLNGTTLFWIDDVNSDGINEVIVGMENALVTYGMRK